MRDKNQKKILWILSFLVIFLWNCSGISTAAQETSETKDILKVISVEITENGDEAGESAVEESVYYYNGKRIAVVTIQWQYSLKELMPNLPELVVYEKIAAEKQNQEFHKCEKLSTDVWKQVPGTEFWQAAVELPAGINEEIEYQLRMEFDEKEEGIPFTGVNVTGGKFQSRIFVIDTRPPLLQIEYLTEAANVVKDGKNHSGKKPVDGYQAYYHQEIRIRISVEDRYAEQEKQEELKNFTWNLYKDGAAEAISEKAFYSIQWKHQGTKQIAEILLKADQVSHKNDGTYQFRIQYEDYAGNPLKGMKDGMYESPMFVIDTICPIVTVSYENTANVTAADGKNYFHTSDVTFRIKTVDRNLRCQELKNTLKNIKTFDLEGKTITTEMERQILALNGRNVLKMDGKNAMEETSWILEFSMKTNAEYEIPVKFTDLAGNPAIINGTKGQTVWKAVVDTQPPNVKISDSMGTLEDEQKEGIIFVKEPIRIRITGTDQISGIREIRVLTEKKDGKKSSKKKVFERTDKGTYEIKLPETAADFQGTMEIEVTDWCGNQSYLKRIVIVESIEKHQQTGEGKIVTVTKPGRTVRGIDYYNQEVTLKVVLEDLFSGIRKWNYQVDSVIEKTAEYQIPEKAELTAIQYHIEEQIILKAKQDETKAISVKAEGQDNTGHRLWAEQHYYIDVTKPIITVEYDQKEPVNGCYYQKARTAVVQIWEQNFEESDVEFLITSANGAMPQISEWSRNGQGENTYYQCKVLFEKDDEYTFSVRFQDLAGNQADYDRVDKFVIDQTPPEVTVVYDHERCRNEKYYKEPRTAEITVKERNFNPEGAEIRITADGILQRPTLEWIKTEDCYKTKISYTEDAEYTFEITVKDNAGNTMEPYKNDYFVIDQTPPKLQILGVADLSANRRTVRPEISVYDRNYDKDSIQFEMNGKRHGKTVLTGTGEQKETGFFFRSADFEYTKENDDIYTIQASAYDLAGNKSEAEIRFSVNRFGSVYTFDDATEALAGQQGIYYTKQEPELVVTETNADFLKVRKIIKNLNGTLTTLKEGKDYSVQLQGTEESWKQYVYTIYAHNFREEGAYLITIYSEDQADNVSDNHSKEKQLEFVVDKTAPEILVSGIEEDGHYRTGSQEFLISLGEYEQITFVRVRIDGKEYKYSAEQIKLAEGTLQLNVKAAKHVQNVQITAEDWAGNYCKKEINNIQVNGNLFVLLYLNHPLLLGMVGIGGMSVIIGWYLIKRKKYGN